MKTVLLVVAMLLCLFSVTVQAEPNGVNVPEPVSFEKGITLSALFPDTGQDEDINFLGRLGYRYGVFEGFIGTDDRVDLFEIGFRVFSRDVAEPGAVPIVSSALGNFINAETMVIRGYSGAHRIMGLGEDDYSGALLGLEQKEKESPVSLNFETQLNDNQTVRYFLGLTWLF